MPITTGAGKGATLYQVSTSAALVVGAIEGAVQVKSLPEHGDLGLGTFEDLDGEMVIVDGHVFQLKGDGSVRERSDDGLAAFVAITKFVADTQMDLERAADLNALLTAFTQLRHSENVFYALRVDGNFDYMHVRAVCKSAEGTHLLDAAAAEREFEFRNVTGSLVGFWTPEYAKTLNVPGYHLHFLSSDRTHGGHLIECSGSAFHLQVQQINDFHVTLPKTQSFLNADLRHDPSADLAKAEGAQK
jgi:acetolactate decarboxylase